MLDLSHKRLDIWKFSLELVTKIYSLTSDFPKEELFGITNQLRRASVSVSSNIAEGLSRSSKLEKSRFLEIARSSIVEIEKLLNSLFAMRTSLKKKIK